MKKKILFVLACVWFIITFLLVQVAYSKYLTSFDASASVQIAVWNIVLNNQNIIQNDDFSSNVTLTFPGDQYRAANYIVPGAIGYFDLVIDTSEVSIPFIYTVTVVPSDDNEIDDIKAIGYSINGNNNVITNLDATHTQIQNSASAGDLVSSIRVYVKWEDEDVNQFLNNIADTNIALDEGIASIDVTVNFEQIMQSTPTPTATAIP